MMRSFWRKYHMHIGAVVSLIGLAMAMQYVQTVGLESIVAMAWEGRSHD